LNPKKKVDYIAWLPDFSWCNIPKLEQNIQFTTKYFLTGFGAIPGSFVFVYFLMPLLNIQLSISYPRLTTKYTKWTFNLPKRRKIYQMPVKHQQFPFNGIPQ
jgi:hypothetical protein